MKAAKKFALFPPLGLALLSAILKKEGFHVKIIDAEAFGLDEEDFFNVIKEYQPHVVGCTLWTPNLKGNLSVLKKVKKLFPKIKTAVGGPHLDIYPKEVLEQYNYIDYGVVGEGEISAIKLMKKIFTEDIDFSDVKGIVYRDSKGEVKFNNSQEPVKNLDDIPYPDFSDLDMNKYFSILEKKPPFMYLFTTRGCPYKCRYCVNTRGFGIRIHSVKYTIDYIKHLKKLYNFSEIHFYDETFTYNKKRTIELCNEIIKQNLNIQYTIRTRVDRVDEDIIKALKESGCFRIGFGVESGNQEILDLMDRKVTLIQVKNAFKLCKKYKIETSANFMIGYLNESRITYKKTVDFILELAPDFVSINITFILPKTDLFYQAKEQGLVKRDIWYEYASGQIDSIDVKALRLPGKDYTVDDLDEMLAKAYMRFYFRPSHILKTLKKVTSVKHFFRYFNMAIAMISNYVETIFKSPKKSG